MFSIVKFAKIWAGIAQIAMGVFKIFKGILHLI